MKTHRQVVVAVSAALLLLAGLPGLAQSKKLGAYTGTISFSGTQMGPEVKYAGRLTLTVPITSRGSNSESAEFFSGEAPNGKLQLTQWDISHTNTFKGLDGKYQSYKCSLAAPVEIPVSVTGVLDIDLKGKRHALSVVVLSLQDAAFNCVNSHSGPYKEKRGVNLGLGTGVPGEHANTQLPYADVSRLAAKYTLVPGGDLKKTHGPIAQEWDFKRVQ